MSALFKWIELRFASKLKAYLLKKMDNRQTGFVPGLGTGINIRDLVYYMRKAKKKFN